MLGARGDPAFVARIRGFSEQRLRSLLPGDAAPPPPGSSPRELCLSFLAHAGIGALAWWLEKLEDARLAKRLVEGVDRYA